MNPQPSKPTATNPMTAIAQIVDAPSEPVDTGFSFFFLVLSPVATTVPRISQNQQHTNKTV
jgi:hypothetical protein